MSAGLSLSCYVCNSAPTNEDCNGSNTTQICLAPLEICMTVVDIAGTKKAISKSCASKATCNGAAGSASVDSNGNGNTVDCCNSFNLCNFSGAESMHTHTALLLTAAALLLLSH
ncbi:hypothetical protein JOQ06_025149 [Pogonophryne albipinna]|uniref:UPAR/Ly6 domain-containing protein n=1 Tax=Pogonophryne albipinna TaxID=1090488 RepID=A0AAD6FEF5_9TELE|nr:hypothetical protein JOQ06_025149 [Pogonophryne albipinna]